MAGLPAVGGETDARLVATQDPGIPNHPLPSAVEEVAKDVYFIYHDAPGHREIQGLLREITCP